MPGLARRDRRALNGGVILPGRTTTHLFAGLLLGSFLAIAGNPAREPGRDDQGYPTNVVEAVAQGRADAERDVRAGHLVIRTGGLLSLEVEDYRALLRDRCGVELRATHGCLVTPGLRGYADAYNQVTRGVITQRFGGDILQRLWTEATDRYQQRMMAGGDRPTPTSRDAARKVPGGEDRKPVVTGTGSHEVQAGDTLTRIAAIHRVPLAVLRDANPGVDPRRLRIGQRLVVPIPADR